MQTFLPYPDFNKSAQVLDYRRLGKQRVEAWQILNILLDKYGYVCKYCGHEHMIEVDFCLNCGKSRPWINHPAVKMWRGYEVNLAYYGWTVCKEWKYNRGYKDTLMEKFYQYFDVRIDNTILLNLYKHQPEWLGNEQFHSSHRAALLAKDYEYYSQFGWTEEPILNYFWPTKEGY